MKPIGTISMYYPFIKRESREILDSIFESSYNYYDFVSSLVDKVCLEETSEELVHLASFHALRLFSFRLLEKLSKHHLNTSIARPYLQLVGPFFYEEVNGFDQVKATIKDLLPSIQEPWIEFRMQALNYIIEDMIAPGGSSEERALIRMREIVSENPELACFEAELTHYKSWQIYEIDADYLECIRLEKEALTLARNYDDQMTETYVLKDLAKNLHNFDITKSMRILNEAKNKAEKLGFSRMIDEIVNFIGHHHIGRGEYTLALDCLQEAIHLAEKERSPSMGVYPGTISAVYNQIGLGAEALEWAQMYLDTTRVQPKDIAVAYFNMAEVLATLGRIEEAEKNLIMGRKESLGIGKESLSFRDHYTSAMLEKAKGNYLDAIYELEQAWEITQKIGRQDRINKCLLKLTECELAQLAATTIDSNANASGEWMVRLEKEVTEKDLPGIRGLFLILKAKLRLMQERKDEVGDMLEEVQSISTQPGLLFLKNMIQ